jgi:hypothetical protein
MGETLADSRLNFLAREQDSNLRGLRHWILSLDSRPSNPYFYLRLQLLAFLR